MAIGDRIKEERIYKGWSQAELAKRAGLNRNSIYRYEKNEVMPRMPQLKRIAEALEMTVEKLQEYRPTARDLINEMKLEAERMNILYPPKEDNAEPLAEIQNEYMKNPPASADFGDDERDIINLFKGASPEDIKRFKEIAIAFFKKDEQND